MIYDILVTADGDGDETVYRIQRLHRVIGYVEALTSFYGNNNVFDKLHQIHDHEGDLTVTWKSFPTDGEKEFFVKAWKSNIGDTGGGIEHELLELSQVAQ